MFFTPQRTQFFKPLTGKYREQVVQCLCLLYQRLYSANADYGHSLGRDALVEIFEEALARAPVLDGDEDEESTRFKNLREQATWVLKQLLEFGWLEKQVDAATLHSTYPFSRMGRLFAQSLVETDNTHIRTRHRNTRNTLNALEAFIHRGEVHDLLDAFEYSERIVTDFTDVIAELEERKRELVREVESQQLVQNATDQFFEFMEKRFAPDVSVRLSADSVEKHRANIHKAIQKIRRKKSDTKRTIELELRRVVPEMVVEGQSVLWFILDTIERRMSNAADIMLPALRKALHGFTKRADIIIRQLSYLNTQNTDDIAAQVKQLQQLSPGAFDEAMLKASEPMTGVAVRLIDPAGIKLIERKKPQLVKSQVNGAQTVDVEAQKALFVQQLLDQAFAMNNQTVRDYIKAQFMDAHKVSSKALPVESAQDLLAMAHCIEVGAINHQSSDFKFRVNYKPGPQVSNAYFSAMDEFEIELVAKV